MGSVLKGIVVGLACFGLGFAALSVLLPPEEISRQSAQTEPLRQDAGASTDTAVADDLLDPGPAPVPEHEHEPEHEPEPEHAPERVTEPAVEALAAQGDDEPDATEQVTADDAAIDVPTTEAPAPEPEPLPEPEPALVIEPAVEVQGEEEATASEQVTAHDAAIDVPTAEDPASDAPSGQEAEVSLEPAVETSLLSDSEDPVTSSEGAISMAGSEDWMPEATEQRPAGTDVPSANEEQPRPADDEAAMQPGPDTQAAPTVASDEASPAAVSILRAVPPAPGLPRTVEGVRVGRLPSIGDAAPLEEEAEPSVADDTQDPEQPAYRRHAAAYEAGVGPLFSVILLDAPADAGAEAALLALPFAVSIALDPGDPDAPRRATAYRDAGHEIVILAAGLPTRATPSDLEVTFDGWFRALPQTVALLDVPEGGFQGNRALAQQIMPFLEADGHGLITQERGLNPAQQSARSAGVASATVFRIIDSDNENQFTIRRYLDRATFRAQQEGRVVVMGRAAHPETIAGLIGWRMEGRAGQVTIAPVSAQLAPE